MQGQTGRRYEDKDIEIIIKKEEPKEFGFDTPPHERQQSPQEYKGKDLLSIKSNPPTSLVMFWSKEDQSFVCDRFSSEEYQQKIQYDDLILVVEEMRRVKMFKNDSKDNRCSYFILTLVTMAIVTASAVYMVYEPSMKLYAVSLIVGTCLSFLAVCLCLMSSARFYKEKRTNALREKIMSLNSGVFLDRQFNVILGREARYIEFRVSNIRLGHDDNYLMSARNEYGKHSHVDRVKVSDFEFNEELEKHANFPEFVDIDFASSEPEREERVMKNSNYEGEVQCELEMEGLDDNETDWRYVNPVYNIRESEREYREEQEAQDYEAHHCEEQNQRHTNQEIYTKKIHADESQDSVSNRTTPKKLTAMPSIPPNRSGKMFNISPVKKNKSLRSAKKRLNRSMRDNQDQSKLAASVVKRNKKAEVALKKKKEGVYQVVFSRSKRRLPIFDEKEDTVMKKEAKAFKTKLYAHNSPDFEEIRKEIRALDSTNDGKRASGKVKLRGRVANRLSKIRKPCLRSLDSDDCSEDFFESQKVSRQIMPSFGKNIHVSKDNFFLENSSENMKKPNSEDTGNSREDVILNTLKKARRSGMEYFREKKSQERFKYQDEDYLSDEYEIERIPSPAVYDNFEEVPSSKIRNKRYNDSFEKPKTLDKKDYEVFYQEDKIGNVYDPEIEYRDKIKGKKKKILDDDFEVVMAEPPIDDAGEYYY